MLWNGNFNTSEEVAHFFSVMAPLYSYFAQKNINDNNKNGSKNEVTFSIDPLNYAFKTFFRTFDYINELYKITCKTLILCGKHDWINDPKHAVVTFKGIPNAVLKIYEDCGHFIALDQHEKYINDIFGFVNGKKIVSDISDQLFEKA